jgi:hypothetical protein
MPLSTGPANDTSPLNILGALDAIGADTIQALWGRAFYLRSQNNTEDTQIPSLTTIIWEPREWCDSNDERCSMGITSSDRIVSSRTYSGQTMGPVKGFRFGSLNTTMINLLITVRDAIQ